MLNINSKKSICDLFYHSLNTRVVAMLIIQLVFYYGVELQSYYYLYHG